MSYIPAVSLICLILLATATNAAPALQEYQLRQEAERLALGGAAALAGIESFWARQGIARPLPSITLEAVLAKPLRHGSAVPWLKRLVIPAALLGIVLVLAAHRRRRRG